MVVQALVVVVREFGNNVILLHFIAVGGHCHRKVRIKNQEVGTDD